MASLTNVTAETLDVDLGKHDFKRTVEPGETLDISDYILTDYAWPSVTWRIDGTDVVTLQGDVYQTPPEIVAEEGPELRVPSSPGTVIPALVDVPLPDTNESE